MEQAGQTAVAVSVIVPALNAADTVAAAVESALGQTLPALEVLVVDDGSTDDTPAIVAGLADRDSRVTLLRHEATRGVSAARNTALQVAQGEWVAPLDADDRFAPERLAILLNAALQRGLDVIIDNLVRIDAATGRSLGPAFPREWLVSPDPVELDFMMRHDFPGQHDFGLGYCKPVFRAAMLRGVGGYREGLQCAEDVLALQLAMYAGARVGTVPDALYLYRHGTFSLSLRQGAYPLVSQVNRMIRGIDRMHGGRMQDLLAARQTEIDYDGFVHSAKERKWSDLAYFLRSMPKTRLLRGLGIAALKRLGLRADPSMDRTPIPPLSAPR